MFYSVQFCTAVTKCLLIQFNLPACCVMWYPNITFELIFIFYFFYFFYFFLHLLLRSKFVASFSSFFFRSHFIVFYWSKKIREEILFWYIFSFFFFALPSIYDIAFTLFWPVTVCSSLESRCNLIISDSLRKIYDASSFGSTFLKKNSFRTNFFLMT